MTKVCMRKVVCIAVKNVGRGTRVKYRCRWRKKRMRGLIYAFCEDNIENRIIMMIKFQME